MKTIELLWRKYYEEKHLLQWEGCLGQDTHLGSCWGAFFYSVSGSLSLSPSLPFSPPCAYVPPPSYLSFHLSLFFLVLLFSHSSSFIITVNVVHQLWTPLINLHSHVLRTLFVSLQLQYYVQSITGHIFKFKWILQNKLYLKKITFSKQFILRKNFNKITIESVWVLI